MPKASRRRLRKGFEVIIWVRHRIARTSVTDFQVNGFSVGCIHKPMRVTLPGLKARAHAC